ncbi:DivIVA domain-containing protein [Liquorilactobacillus satsumensis]|uniref:DivIVA domain-containing protein n=1 Tax=Liquorilactobacillus satsumensis TaxID=259059 RepID=UPI001E4715E3|nr:DivIVA domain-containing protein [Liquorilactobacillus satsumensis]MCC7665582.1 cell division protein DivIVA [Liquorilactobacillus satsumensis]MCP9311794.1 DivIVA domain-containing protein [Liquorilactobacillus satsumensis]MCP9357340.1 DivIVA domain-containing protein [Liquorilactobacillus satsumensis]MCP9358927.1 DivIVA domain-containing protein [Liquorilactobacillus satsumensis]MCP9372100.1 DivIVA domain-containing protein [Liquorilactobacillus satsumensis]
MTLTPLDIHNKEFRVKLRGYDQDEVNDFLDQIIKDYELNLKENEHLSEGLKQSQEKLKYFNDLKDSLNQSIIVAQEAADKVKANSQREAEIINREAQKQAQDVVDQANEKARHIIEGASQKAKRLIFETDDLKKQARIFRQKLQVMLESQLEVVKGSEWDDILKQGDTSNYEEIQEAIRREEELDKKSAKEVKSFSNVEAQKEQETGDNQNNKAVVIFPEEDDGGQHFDEVAADAQKNK